MKKYSTIGYIIVGIIFALISIIAVAVPTLKTATFWIAYLFTAISFASQIITWRTALGKKTLKSKFLGFSVVQIGIVYTVIQTVAFTVFLFVPTFPVWSAFVVCSIIACVSFVCMISANVGSNEIERVEAKVQKKVFYIRELKADIELLVDNESNGAIKMALSQLAEKIRFSDPMGNEQLADLESKIYTKVMELKTGTYTMGDIIELNSLLDERNEKCKILK